MSGESSTTWTGAVSDNWDDSKNWTNGVPTSSSDVIINNMDGVVTINLTTSAFLTVNSISTSVGAYYGVTINGNSGSSGATYLTVGTLDVPDGSTFHLAGGLISNISHITGGGSIQVEGSSTLSSVQDFSANLSFSDVGNGAQHNYVSLFSDAMPESVSGLSPNDTINFNSEEADTSGIHPTWVENSDGSSYNLVDHNGTTILKDVTFAPGYTTADMTWDSSGGTLNCFLAGSMISTPEGVRAVEDIRIGDDVTVFDWRKNIQINKKVIWVGSKTAHTRADLPEADAGYPVRILKDALADGVPYKDMLITPEHCLFFEGKFIPARMLVNGATIFYDTSITTYEYYHVETEEHSVIRADGVLTESYLDTGSRRSFQQKGNLVTLGFNPAKSWAEDAAAPLEVSRSVVEPLFRALELRTASVAGHRQTSVQNAELTQQPDLHLVTNTGATVLPIKHVGKKYSFMLPPHTESVRIMSRAGRPADVIGPFVDDRRSLGVAVGTVCCISAQYQENIMDHLQGTKPEGWYSVESGQYAWTNGNAVLPLPAQSSSAINLLSIEICAAGPYLLADDAAAGTMALSA